MSNIYIYIIQTKEKIIIKENDHDFFFFFLKSIQFILLEKNQ